MPEQTPLLPTSHVSHLGPLDAVIAQINAAYAARDFELTHHLLNEYLLETWFGLSPEKLLKMTFDLASNGVVISQPLQAIRAMMLASSEGQAAGVAESAVTAVEPSEPSNTAEQPDDYVQTIGRAFGLRLHGHSVEALRLLELTSSHRAVTQTLFDATGGLTLFSVLQHGFTAMLAGDMHLAETRLTEAMLKPLVPTLPFLTRDAHSKFAVLHACFGDPSVALTEIALAEQQPRTTSWIEASLDAQIQLARALVHHDAAEAIAWLDAIPLSALGEMWPFYAYAVHTVHSRAGQHSEAVRRLETLDQTQLPRIDGVGFAGSVLPSLLAFSALSSGNMALARKQWLRVDPNIVTSKIGTAAFALASGDARRAERLAMEVRADTRGLRQVELWRLALLAASSLQRGDQEGCLEVLRAALTLPRGLSPNEARIFHEDAHVLATKHLDSWPVLAASAFEGLARIPLKANSSVTDRELEVLGGLARGLTREQIARELFVSVNTIKAHQQSLYRKLEVSSRNAAVFEAESRGLI